MRKTGRVLLSSLALSALASMSGCHKEELDAHFSGTTSKIEYHVGDVVQFAETSEDVMEKSSFLNAKGSVPLSLKSGTVMEPRFEVPAGKHVVLQYDSNLSAADFEELRSKGVHVLHAVDEKAYLVSLNDPASLDTSTKRAVGLVNPKMEDKVSEHILRNADTWNGKLVKNYVVTFYDDVDPVTIENILKESGVDAAEHTILNSAKVSLDASKKEDFIYYLAGRDEVEFIWPSPIPLTHTNYNSRMLAETDALQGDPLFLDGSGITLGVYDGGLIEEDAADLEGRLIRSDLFGPAPNSYHALHVSCTAAGDGASSLEYISAACHASVAGLTGYSTHKPNKLPGTSLTTGSPEFSDFCALVMNEDGTIDADAARNFFKGVAPATRVISNEHGDCSPQCLADDPNDIVWKYLEMVLGYDAKVITNSIGSNASFNGLPCEINGAHELTAWIVNAFVLGSGWEKPVTISYAAGNERGGFRCYDEEIGFDTIGAPAAGAKNAIIVGATEIYDNELRSAFYSSYGPTDDGRIGITVTANGGGFQVEVMSCASDGWYTGLEGTSMATPFVSGTAILIYEYAENTGIEMKPSLVKAILVNSASDLGEAGPDFKFGFGDLVGSGPKIKDTLMKERFRTGTLEDGEMHTYYFFRSSDEGKISLAYTDAHESPHAEKVLVNDLDLEIVSPFGETFLPLVPDAIMPEMAAAPKKDSLNNVEQVVVPGNVTGMREIWKVHVAGSSVVMPAQEYALASSFDVVKVEPAVLSSSGDAFDGALIVNAYKFNCTQVCGLALVDVPLNDLETRTTRHFDGDLRLADVFPGFIPQEEGYYRLLVSVVDSTGLAVYNKDGRPIQFNYDFYVK